MVRVLGYSARFMDLPRAVQNDINSRFCFGKVRSCLKKKIKKLFSN